MVTREVGPYPCDREPTTVRGIASPGRARAARQFAKLREEQPLLAHLSRIWTRPIATAGLIWDRWSQLLTYIRLRDAAGQHLRREPRWVFARFHLKAPMTLERHAGPHIRFGKRRSDRFAISCHLLQLPGRDLLSLFAASVHAAFTDSAGS